MNLESTLRLMAGYGIKNLRFVAGLLVSKAKVDEYIASFGS